MLRVVTHAFFSVLTALAGSVGVFLVITRVSPETRASWTLFTLYSAVFLTAYGISSIGGLGVRRVLSRGLARHEHVRGANRQGILFGIMIVSLLILSSAKLFNFWSAGLLFAILVLFELYIQ